LKEGQAAPDTGWDFAGRLMERRHSGLLVMGDGDEDEDEDGGK